MKLDRYCKVYVSRRRILVCDTTGGDIRALCTCDGWAARDDAEEITVALNERYDKLMLSLRVTE